MNCTDFGRKKLSVPLTAIFTLGGLALSTPAAFSAGPPWKIFLRQGWEIQSSAKINKPGGVISTAGFAPKDWYPAAAPTTVLAALVADHAYPDPYFGTNLRSIPGTNYPIGANFSNIAMPADSPFRAPWWYRTEFRLPGSYQGKNLWLHFDGINYRADVWLNGVQVASSDKMAGMWRLFEFNVTKAARPGHTNTLAVEVLPPTPDSLSITWVDWNPMPPDKEMGIWRDVYISATGPVVLRYPQVLTQLDLPSLDVAHLTLSANLENTSAARVQGFLKGRLGEVEVSLPVELGPGEAKLVTFAPDKFPALSLAHPRIWWPAQMGKPELYSLQMEFDSGGQVSDRQTLQFGIREITSTLDAENHRVFMVNGRRLLIRGGGWSSDMLLRPSPEREDDEISYALDMGLNTIRLEGKLEDEHFFDLADRYGVLVLAGWCCCDHWEMWRKWKEEDYGIATESLRDQLRRLRNHPSLLAWLYGSDNPPPKRVEAMYLEVIKDERWPNPYISSATAKPTAGLGPSGVKMTGPYEYVAPSYWLEDGQHGGAFGFNTETSPGPAIPVIESLRQMLPADHLWPIDNFWNFHAGGGEFKNLSVFNRALEARYGKATDVEDYAEKAQLMTYAGERAMFEAYSREKYRATGVIQWMLNNAWPSVIWHLYDWYLRPGGGYFGTKKACEPVHIMYSPNDSSIAVINSTYQTYPGLRARAQVLNLDLTEKFSREAQLDAGPDSTNTPFVLPELADLSKTYFLKLDLMDSSSHVLSRNFYWLSTKPDVSDWDNSTWYYTPIRSYADYTALNSLPRVRVDVSSASEDDGSDEITRVTVRNPTSHLAFFVHLEIRKGKDGEDVRPIRWEDNYIALLPGESREIKATYRASQLGGARPVARVDGWNVETSFE
jgi:exo-1,4-beta-D-glucosaminidase